MQIRKVAPWLVLPSLLVVAAACLVLARVSSVERDETARLAADARRYDVLLSAQSWVEEEAETLIALRVLAAPPPELDDLADAAAVDVGSPAHGSDARRDLVDDLYTTEAMMGPVRHDLQLLVPMPQEVARVLAPLDPASRNRLEVGDERFLPAGDYAQAIRWLGDRADEHQTRAEAATRALADQSRRPAYWRTSEFALFAAGLVLFAVLGAIVAVWRVTASTRRLGEMHAEAKREAAHVAARADQLQSVIALGRRLSSDAEPGLLAATIVGETSALLAPEVCALLLVEDAVLLPAAAGGVHPPAAVSFRDGVAGRAAETGTPVRTVVPADPLLPTAVGPLSLLAMPLTHDGRVAGVLVLARQSAVMFDADDEMVLSLIGMMSAGALRVAERYGSTLALAMHDPLTGLGNRRRLDRDLGAIAPERSGPVAFLMVDIDHFKRFNDRYGHPSGDALLRSVGEAIARAVRSGDIAYRFGGEEFSVLLPDTDGTTAMAVAERVRRCVAAVDPPSGTEPVTVSIGVSVVEPNAPSTRLVDEADRALYDAKRAGRDRVTLAAVTVAAPTGFAPPTEATRAR